MGCRLLNPSKDVWITATTTQEESERKAGRPELPEGKERLDLPKGPKHRQEYI